ncbi:MAG: response regulator [Candidatus Omnitrophica bacterium]|nr:response regulator [Candidatus Omnitrophota bacterium]
MANPKILICDEQEEVRESLKSILADHYELITVDSPSMAVDILSHTKDIKVMLLNILMPLTEGPDDLKEIKKKFPQLRVIMVGGHKSAQITVPGANGHIVKPFKPQEILDLLKKHITPLL